MLLKQPRDNRVNRIFLCSVMTMVLLLPSCAPEGPGDAAKIDGLRTDAEKLIREQSLMGWNSWVYGTESNQDSLYRAYAHLFTRENIGMVKRAEEREPDAIQKKRLRYLRSYLTSEYLTKQIASLADRVNNLEAEATVLIDGREVPYRELSSLMANELHQQRRAVLYAAADPVLDSINVLLRDVKASYQRLAPELGFQSYTHMAEELKGFSLSEFKLTAERVLAETESLYTSLLTEVLKRELKLDPSRFHRYDTGSLFRSRRFDKYFPAAAMMDVLATTYKGMGIDIPAMTNLRIDAEPREKKNPRAVCFPVDVPNDVRLSIKPIGGVDDYSALLHEVGHGLHYASTQENAFEFKYLGEYTVTETYAFLSEYLLANQAWLRLHSKMPTPVLKDFLRFQAFHRLWYVRRYCAKFLYELELHAGAPDPQRLYAQWQRRGVGITVIPSDEKRYLTDVDALFYSATYLRAWFLEAQLNQKLTTDFGTNWFEHPGAGAFLQSMWARGDKLNGDELAQLIGFDGISAAAVLDEIRSLVLFSTK
jgi:hypothetical protein